jgi:hypothetical protein
MGRLHLLTVTKEAEMAGGFVSSFFEPLQLHYAASAFTSGITQRPDG